MDDTYQSRSNKKRLYVGNLLYEVNDKDLVDLFTQAGSVTSANIIRLRDGRSKGFAFVEMQTEEAAQSAIKMFDKQDFRGRKMFVSLANDPKPRE